MFDPATIAWIAIGFFSLIALAGLWAVVTRVDRREEQHLIVGDHPHVPRRERRENEPMGM